MRCVGGGLAWRSGTAEITRRICNLKFMGSTHNTTKKKAKNKYFAEFRGEETFKTPLELLQKKNKVEFIVHIAHQL
jgi:hypothetical protein